jgi:hypothetical protein
MFPSRRLQLLFCLIIALATIMACDLPGPTEVPGVTHNAPQIAYEYSGDGTYTQVIVLAGETSSCTIPVDVSATIYDNGAVSIKSIGPCINDFNGCKLDETDRCAMYGEGTVGGFAMAVGGPIDMTGCNTGTFTISMDNVEFDSDHLVGSFQCDMGGGDSMSTSMDIPRINK